MQQDNLINPQSVNEVIQTLFGSYEKFVMGLIERRKELEDEKLRLTTRLKEIEKEEGLIKSVLTGSPLKKGSNSQLANSEKSPDLIKEKLCRLQKEEELIKKVLIGFHGKKINGQFFNAENNSLENSKPQKSEMGGHTSSFQAIGHLLAFKKEEYNKEAGNEIINDENLFSAPVFKPENSIEPNPQAEYKNQIFSLLKQEYLLSNDDLQNIDKKKVNEAFSTGITPRDFVNNIAQEIKLEKVQNKQGMRI